MNLSRMLALASFDSADFFDANWNPEMNVGNDKVANQIISVDMYISMYLPRAEGNEERHVRRSSQPWAKATIAMLGCSERAACFDPHLFEW